MSAALQPALQGLTHGQTFRRSPHRGVRSLRCSLRGWEPHLEPKSAGLGTRRRRRRPSRQDLYRGAGPANCGDLWKTQDSDQVLDPRAAPLKLAGGAALRPYQERVQIQCRSLSETTTSMALSES